MHFITQDRSFALTARCGAGQVPVRPFRHDEFERFLTAAYPYYTLCLHYNGRLLYIGLHRALSQVALSPALCPKRGAANLPS